MSKVVLPELGAFDLDCFPYELYIGNYRGLDEYLYTPYNKSRCGLAVFSSATTAFNYISALPEELLSFRGSELGVAERSFDQAREIAKTRPSYQMVDCLLLFDESFQPKVHFIR